MARHGENIHKRKDGRWEARIIVSYDDHNKAVYKSVYGNSYEEVKAKKENMSGSSAPSRRSSMTFGQAAELWLNTKKGNTKTSTYNHYLNQYQLHIRQSFASRKLLEIHAEDYNRFLQKKEAEGYSPGTVLLLRTIIKMVLYYAELTAGIPSVQGIYIPKQSKKQVLSFTRQEQNTVNQYLFDHLDHYALSILISMYCGLRIGEVCALQWKDLNLNNGILSVSRTLIRIQNKETSGRSKSEVVFQKPKTESSNRKVPIPDFLKKLLMDNFKDEPDSYVITGNDHYMEPRVCLRKFKKLMKKLQLEDYSFHVCRHTYATRCVELGIDPKLLSELLGHSSVRTTLDRYVHPSMDFKKEQVNKLSLLSEQNMHIMK